MSLRSVGQLAFKQPVKTFNLAKSAQNYGIRNLINNRNYSTATGKSHRSSSAATQAAQAVSLIRRGASFSFYTIIVLGGLGIVGITGYYLAQELILPSSDGQIFHKAFKMIEKDPKCTEMLGTHLKAHGEFTNQRNVKSRPIASSRVVDRFGFEHVVMQFHVDGEKAQGIAKLEVIMNKSQLEFRYLLLDVPGFSRHYLINEAAKNPKRAGSFFGIKWGTRASGKRTEE